MTEHSTAAILRASDDPGLRPSDPPHPQIAPNGAQGAPAATTAAAQSRSEAVGENAAADRSPHLDGFGRREALVLAIVAGHECGVPGDHILGRDRRPAVVHARQLAMAVARRLGYSLPAVGQAFGRDHTTALHAERTIAERAERDTEIAAALWRIAASAALQLERGDVELPPAPRPQARRTAAEVVGTYHTSHGARRRLVLTTCEGGRELVDCARGDLRVVDEFTRSESVLHIAAVARDYLARARAERRPLVAKRDET